MYRDFRPVQIVQPGLSVPKYPDYGGLPSGQTLKSAPGITENLMKNKLDRDEALKQGGTPGVGSQIFSVVFSLLLILGGFLLIIL